jgi:hypothetical protein
MFPQFITTTVGLAIAAYSIQCLNIASLLLFVAYITVVIKVTFHIEYSGKCSSADAALAVIDSSPLWAALELIVHPLRYGIILTFATYLYIQCINHFMYV